jgi:hypothetical protein
MKSHFIWQQTQARTAKAPFFTNCLRSPSTSSIRGLPVSITRKIWP